MNQQGLKKNADFKKVYRKGRSFATKILVMYYKPNGLEYNRIGFSISKKVGKAVVRNRIRRRLKENLKNRTDLPSGFDMIFVARVGISQSDFHEIRKNLDYIFRKTGLSKKNNDQNKKIPES